MRITEQQAKEIQAYIAALEKFCAYTINSEINTFWTIAAKPQLIGKWREKIALKLFNREDYSLYYIPRQNAGTILKLSGYFNEPIADTIEDDNGCLNGDRSDWNQSIKDIDRQICKGLLEDIINKKYIADEYELTDRDIARIVTELRKPLEKTSTIKNGATT